MGESREGRQNALGNYSVGPKRQRTGALQNLSECVATIAWEPASWSAAAINRFGRVCSAGNRLVTRGESARTTGAFPKQKGTVRRRAVPCFKTSLDLLRQGRPGA